MIVLPTRHARHGKGSSLSFWSSDDRAIEAWLLAERRFFEALHADLTAERVASILGEEIAEADSESINHPAAVIDRVLRTVGLKYRKNLDDAHRVAEALNYEELYLVHLESIPALRRFVGHLESALE